MTTPATDTLSHDALSRYIDRFLFADGWRVGEVGTVDAGYVVTLRKVSGAGEGAEVTGQAPSAGEATFKACGQARRLDLESGA